MSDFLGDGEVWAVEPAEDGSNTFFIDCLGGEVGMRLGYSSGVLG